MSDPKDLLDDGSAALPLVAKFEAADAYHLLLRDGTPVLTVTKDGVSVDGEHTVTSDAERIGAAFKRWATSMFEDAPGTEDGG